MRQMEFERKKVISESEYLDCLSKMSYLTEYREIMQINYYYDDQDFSLYSNGQTLRVRQIGNILTLEQKIHKRDVDGIRISDERIMRINVLPRRISTDKSMLFYVGNMLTIRKNYVIERFTVSLDKCIYLGVVDYEVEIESEYIRENPTFLDGITSFDKQTLGKYPRFIQKLREPATFAFL